MSRPIPKLYLTLIAMDSGFLGSFDHTLSRVFRGIEAARDYITEIATKAVEKCDAGEWDDYVESALILRIEPDGALTQILEFDGHDRGDGLWVGWSDEQDLLPMRGKYELPAVYEGTLVQNVARAILGTKASEPTPQD